MYFTELVVCCFIALTIPETNEFEIGSRYLVNGMDPCGGRCKQGHCSPEGNGTYKCVCMSGWAGTDCGILAWTLTTAPGPASNGSHNLVAYCNHHGTWNGFSCHCLDNWSGDRCQFAPASTTIDHCHNHCVHGHCEPVYNLGYVVSYHCRCDNQWHGNYCDQQHTSTVATTLDPCHNRCVHGHCEHIYDHFGQVYYHCVCDNNWHGVHCEEQYKSTVATTLDNCHSHCVHGTCEPFDNHGHVSYHCVCDNNLHGIYCRQQYTFSSVSSTETTTKHTLPPLTVTSTHLLSTMITAVHAHGTCNKASMILDILQQYLVDNKNASMCPSGFHTSHEAFVLKNCPASPSPASWHPGAQVMAMCNGGPDSFPGYTAIAAFDDGRYAAVGGLSGILVGCLADGFKMAVQRCDHPPLIKEIHVGGAFLDDPNVYFTIV